MAIAQSQNDIYQQIVNGLFQFFWVIERWNHVKQ